MDNKLFKKTIIWNGDSICAGSSASGNWATRIATKNDMQYKNYAVGGGTVAENLPLLKNGKQRHSVSATFDKMYEESSDADYIIIEGGTNDADLLGSLIKGEKTLIGTFDPLDYSGQYDRSTFCGALESIFYRATKYWKGKKIGFIVGICLFAYLTDYIGDFLETFSLTATRSYSTVARLYALDYYWKYFLSHPLFGFGFADGVRFYSIVHGDGRASISDIGIFGQLGKYGLTIILIYVYPLIRSCNNPLGV